VDVRNFKVVSVQSYCAAPYPSLASQSYFVNYRLTPRTTCSVEDVDYSDGLTFLSNKASKLSIVNITQIKRLNKGETISVNVRIHVLGSSVKVKRTSNFDLLRDQVHSGKHLRALLGLAESHVHFEGFYNVKCCCFYYSNQREEVSVDPSRAISV